SERFLEEDARRARVRPAGKGANLLVAETTVEAGRLVVVRVEVHHPAPTADGLALGPGDETRAQPVPAEGVPPPERADEPRPHPRPPVEPCHHCPGLVPYEDREPAAVVVARR